MKILLLTNQVEVGGIEKNVVRLTGSLVKRAHQVHVISRGGVLVDELEAAGGRHLSIGAPQQRASFIRESIAIRKHLREMEPDVIHVFSATMNTRLQMALLGMKRRPRTIASIMGLQTIPRENVLKTRLRAFLTLVGADKVIIMAPAIADVVKTLPIRSSKIIQMSAVGIELPSDAVKEVRKESRSKLDVSDREQLVMTVGRLDPSKSHELFIDAAARVCATNPDVLFILIGGGSLHGELKSRVPARFAHRILLLGERLDATRLMAAADIYVRPGVVEGFVGITVLEAQAWGIPVVAFDTIDVRLAIEDGVTGMLVRNGDSRALTKAILRLLNHPNEACALGHSGRDFVRRNFSIDFVSSQLERLYTSALGEN